MNLKETKLALESSVKEAIAKIIHENVNVTTAYNMEQGSMNIVMVEPRNDDKNRLHDIIYYNLAYEEEKQHLSVLAFNRVYTYDDLGIASVETSPVVIDDVFVGTLKNVIAYGLDKVYHPEHYVDPATQPAEPAEPADAEKLRELSADAVVDDADVNATAVAN